MFVVVSMIAVKYGSNFPVDLPHFPQEKVNNQYKHWILSIYQSIYLSIYLITEPYQI